MSSKFELFHSYLGEAMTDGFEVLPIRGRPKGSKNKPKSEPEKPAPKASKPKGKPVKVGRPRVYDYHQRRSIAAALRRLGYTKGLEYLRKERKLNISLTLARDVAEEYGIEFKRGRPAA